MRSILRLVTSVLPAALFVAVACGSEEGNDGHGNAKGGAGANTGGASGTGGTTSGGAAGNASGRGGTSGSAGAGGTSTGGAGGESSGGESSGGESSGGESSGGESSGGEGGAPEPDCEPGERRCVGLVRERCSDEGRWETSGPACEFVCVDGGCTGGCVPASTQCTSETERQTCNSAGEWGVNETCPNACVATTCGGECIPGSRRCDDRTRQQCNGSGAWVDDGAECPFSCTNGACTGSCTPNATQCASATEIQTCGSNNEWAAPAPCDFACVADACGGVCTPGDTECVAGTPSTQRRSCGSNGQWDAPSDCTYVCTGDGVCGGECTPGARGCSGDVPRACSDQGQWVNGTACGASDTCNPETGTCEACLPYRCGAGRDWVVWQTIGVRGRVYDVELDAAGNTYFVGDDQRSGAYRDYVGKLDVNGALLWERSGPPDYNLFMRVAIDANGVIWAVGSNGSVVRFSSDGTELDRRPSGAGFLSDIEFDPSGNVYVSGVLGTGASERAYVAKYSPSFASLWARTHGVRSGAQSIAVDSSGNVYMAGRVEIIQGGEGVAAPLLVNRYDTNGSPSFSTVPMAGCVEEFVNPWGATADAAGNLYLTGNHCGVRNTLAEKWSSSGTRLWKADVVTDASGWGNEVQVKSDGNLVYVSGDLEIFSHTPSGQPLWKRTYTTATVDSQGFDMAAPNELVSGATWYRGGPDLVHVVARLRLPPNP